MAPVARCGWSKSICSPAISLIIITRTHKEEVDRPVNWGSVILGNVAESHANPEITSGEAMASSRDCRCE